MLQKHRGGRDAKDFRLELNRMLLAADSVDELALLTCNQIQSYLKSAFCFAYIKHSSWRKARLVGDIADVDINILEPLLNDRQLHVRADQVSGMHNISNKSLLRSLHDMNVAMIANLEQPSHEYQGFLILGTRSSGEAYDYHEQELVGHLAADVGFGLQRAIQLDVSNNANDLLREKLSLANRQLRQTKTRLRSIEQTKDDFISMASHQLRTPLTSVKGYVSMVIDGDAGDLNPTQTQLLSQAFISAQRMVYLISDLLNVSRLRTGKFIIEEIPCDLSKAIDEEVQQLVSTAESRGLTLAFDKPKEFPIYMLDEIKLRQVAMNFIDNAIYYTPSGGKITVALEDKPLALDFTVKDTGMGVPRSEQHRLFSKFFRAGNAQKARPDGTGLGLYMAKKAVIAQGGAIIFKSQEGKGSTFGFTIPKSKLKTP